jgi:PPM family protein phosphatase
VGLAFAGASDIGRVREQNQDAILLPAPAAPAAPLLFLLADGMGGASGGQVASTLAIEVAGQAFRARAPSLGLEVALRQAVEAASAAIHQRALEQPELKGMGTTLVAVAVEGRRALVANVGDSRCYLWREGILSQVTQDHSLVQQLVREGSLSPQQARGHRMRNVVTRVVGVQPLVEADIFDIQLRPADILLLCSDGLHGPVEEADLARVLRQPDANLESKAGLLVQAANARGGPDNISVILVGVAPQVDASPGEYPSRADTSWGKGPQTRQAGGRLRRLGWVLGLAALLGASAWAIFGWPPGRSPAPIPGQAGERIVLEPTAPSSGSPAPSAPPSPETSPR